MMYEAVQQLNGSLARWEKSHDVAVYNQTNRGNTIFAFAYYPKFWRRKLPSFELTLKRLIDKWVWHWSSSLDPICFSSSRQWNSSANAWLRVLGKKITHGRRYRMGSAVYFWLKRKVACFPWTRISCYALKRHSELVPRNCITFPRLSADQVVDSSSVAPAFRVSELHNHASDKTSGILSCCRYAYSA